MSSRAVAPSSTALQLLVMSKPILPAVDITDVANYRNPEPKQFAADAGFDPRFSFETFPPTVVQEIASDEFFDEEGDLPPPVCHVYGWVPNTAPEAEPTLVRPETGQLQTKSATTMPIELFDSPEMELEAPELHLKRVSADGAVHALSRFYDVEGRFAWAECTVLDYNRDTELYTIRWNRTGGQKQVKRLNLVFAKESHSFFRRRLRAAWRRRAEFEALARYYKYVREQPFLNPVILTPEWRKRVDALALPRHANRVPQSVLAVLHEEVLEDYRLAVRAAIVDEELRRGEGPTAASGRKVPRVRLPRYAPECALADIGFGLQGAIIEASSASDGAGVDVAMQPLYVLDIAETLDIVSYESVEGQPVLLDFMLRFMRDMDIFSLTLLDTELRGVAVPMTVGRYLDTQVNYSRRAVDVLSTDWLYVTVKRLEALLPHEPSGEPLSVRYARGDLSEDEVKLCQFMRRITFFMSDQLSGAVLATAAAFQDFWLERVVSRDAPESVTGYPDDLKASMLVPDLAALRLPGSVPHNVPRKREEPSKDGLARASGWGSDVEIPHPVPLFVISLVLTEDRVFALEPTLEEVTRDVLGVYDSVLDELSCIFDLHKRITRNEVVPLSLPSPHHPGISEPRARIAAALDQIMLPASHLLESFAAQFGSTVELRCRAYVDEIMAAQPGVDAVVDELARLQQVETSVRAKVALSEVSFATIKVNAAPAVAAVCVQARRLRLGLIDELASRLLTQAAELTREFRDLSERLNIAPTTAEEVDEMLKFVAETESLQSGMCDRVAALREFYTALDTENVQHGDELVGEYWEAVGWPARILEDLEHAASITHVAQTRHVTELKHDVASLQAKISACEEELQRFMNLGDISKTDDRCNWIHDFEATLNTLTEQAELYQSREEIFELDRTEYPGLTMLLKEFEPTANLWRMCGEFTQSVPDWRDGPFPNINAEQLASDVDRWWRLSAKLLKTIHGPANAVVVSLRADLEEFMKYVPLVVALRNPGLKERHWKRLSTAVGERNLRGDSNFSLSQALQLGLHEKLELVEEVSEFASKEYSLERALDKMQASWVGLALETIPWRNTNTCILKGIDEIQILLDDQVLKTQSMKASPYIRYMEDRCRIWETKLLLVQETLEEMLKCQASWLYLEPIFGSDDILQQMPNEGRKFRAVDNTWRASMDAVAKNPDVLITAGDADLLQSIKDANELLEQVQKGLNEYLETKRLAFPRFYFLSNDELLEILSETKDPLRVQPFLRKIFEGINELEFQSDLTVTAMISEEKERVALERTFNPKNAGGCVEMWLIVCEAIMRSTVKHVIKQAYETCAGRARSDWVLDWPGQIVLAVGSMFWTQEVEVAISKNALQAYADRCTSELFSVVDRVRGQLTKLQRTTLSALIVVDVHARDVVQELADFGVGDATDFEWTSQLRYMWESNEVSVRMINAQIYYGYEYLGNGSRLVITPLTDRCYRTLMGALHLSLGGAPEGPAGTGKTETTKDLAKAIAMQCVVFNCSDGLDYLAMGKFFKGLASSGAWACFDEFNRIDLEVLSVIAQQILTMQRAKAAGVSTFEFEGTRLSLRPTFSVFITMNPGYAGRSELPDNLKALFRSVAMMVPDYALISEIILYSAGYLEARDLARKLVATYRLCSEQLSSQSHYDYGMRAVISVLRAAGANKQKAPEASEAVLMLRSIRDVNAPKFLAPDIPLFEGILSDLFREVELPATDYAQLDDALAAACQEQNLQRTPFWQLKAHEFYEMMLVRHGFMLVGLSYSGKSTIISAVARALGVLQERGQMDEHEVDIKAMNPKSIYMGQLYGQFDPVSHEWQDGVLAKNFRAAATDTSPSRKWILFDGPVDAVWIENMNTVLDDNKKLCLNSGEIIQMAGLMSMIFEVADLLQASPATVSRCGMVYTEPEQMGWTPLRDSWLHTLPAKITAQQRETILELSDWLIGPCLAFSRKNCVELVPSSDANLAWACLQLFECQLDAFADSACTTLNEAAATKLLHAQFVFSVVWSIGATLDTKSQALFDGFLRQLCAQSVDPDPARTDFDLGPGLSITYPAFKLACSVPPKDRGSMFEFKVHAAKQDWEAWMDPSQTQPIDEKLPFDKIIVTTIDTIRYTWLMDSLMRHGKHVLVTGLTGTGKSAYIQRQLDSLDADVFMSIQTAFSAQTNANRVQDLIDMKLDKRRKGIFGPPAGMKAIVFVDDLNMPALEVYGAQPPVELVRQWMDYNGWYDRETLAFRTLVDIQFVTAMGPPGGGRNHVTPRLLRHFNQLCINEFSDASLQGIFASIFDWWARRDKLPEEVAGKGGRVVATTLEVYNSIRATLLPTPAKSHYTFNMRDLAKVFRGMQMIAVPVQDAQELVRLWTHETLRVFHDRLTEDADRTWFMQLVRTKVDTNLGVKFDSTFEPPAGSDVARGDVNVLRTLLYCDFLVPGADAQKYQRVTDMPKLLATVEEYLADYNAQSRTRMSLVLFLYAAQHICRISRVIKQPLGSALLVGVGGSGRRSLARIAAFMAEYDVFDIEVSTHYGMNEWREDLKAVLLKAGAHDKPTVFLVSDTQLKQESFLEDINGILNTGEVPNLFAKDELAGLMEAVTARAKRAGRPLTPKALYQFFVEESRANLHVVLAFSPVGDAFRTRLRKFPALVNCCTIDWFSEWPQDALQAVAKQFLVEVEMESEELRASVEKMCMTFQQSVTQVAAAFKAELGRPYYTTPTSYLELIQTYKQLLATKRTEVHGMRRRYEIGLEKLLAAEAEVNVMKQELIELQPVLVQTGKEVAETLVVVDKESTDAAAVREVVAADEAVASQKAQAAQAIKDECEGELAVAMPLLESALRALDTLTKADITEVKAMKSPPGPVKVVMETVCHMLGVKPKRVNDPNKPGAKVDDYWSPSQALLSDSKFLENLQAFDKDNIAPAVIEKVRPYLELPDFDPDTVKKASKAAYGLCCWVRAMEAYDRVAKVVEPKRAKLVQAEAEVAGLMESLREKQAQLSEVEGRVAALQAKLDEMQGRKKQLEDDVDLCEKKLTRATALIGGLGGEKTRWTAVAATLAAEYTNLTGDVLLAAGAIAYLGAFTAAFRERLTGAWTAACKDQNILCEDTFSLARVLGNPVQIRDWTIAGLPNDAFSIDNAIIMTTARRWPLLIDPQGQANKWIKHMEAANKVVVLKLSDSDNIRKLENCIQFGFPALLENIGEELDATLEPLLLKSIFKEGGTPSIKLGDAVVEYSDKFRFYMTTKLRNPHYLPEVAVKVTLLNFMITPDGLQDQLLGTVVQLERPELQAEKTKLMLLGAENARQLKEVEDKIIQVLSSSEGNILEDETAINVISSSKELSNEISRKQEVAAATEKRIDDARAAYKPVAHRVSVLFFTTSELANIEPMYQYSLAWFVDLFKKTIAQAEAASNVQRRIENLATHFDHFLYVNVCRSLFEKDKLLLSFAMAIAQSAHVHCNIALDQYRFLLTGGVPAGETPANPAAAWLPDRQWTEAVRLAAQVPEFHGLTGDLSSHPDRLREVYESPDPARALLPAPWLTLSPFHRLLLLRILRPDKLVSGIHAFVGDTLGVKFLSPPAFNLRACYADSAATVPLIFVLSPGSDPMSALLRFAEGEGVQVESISLGQGQGVKAEALITSGQSQGGWVVLQNCHLAVSWMPSLENLCEKLTPENTHSAFRLWLTSYPSPDFPVSILQSGVKMTNEPPKGLKANILQSFMSDPVKDPAFFEGCVASAEFKRLLFGLCFFHAFVQERLNFGPLGWNVPYQFSQPDFVISARQLLMFMNDFPDSVPLRALRYLTGECNYGGRVTDAHDRRTLMCILDVFYSKQALREDYSYSASGHYAVPPYDPDYGAMLDHVRALPSDAQPEVFGLHANADIAKDRKEADVMLESLRGMQGAGGGGAASDWEHVLEAIAKDTSERIAAPFDVEFVRFKYPVDYHESMNTVLTQEVVRFNRLIVVLHRTLSDLRKALKGQIVMSAELEAVAHSMYDNQVPEVWKKVSFPSMKPLSSYTIELADRIAMLASWIERGPPTIFWISGFFFTHAFLTGVKQNFARKHKTAIDTIAFAYECVARGQQPATKPEDGALVNGMYVDGARWNADRQVLDEQEPKALFSAAPMMKLTPCEADQLPKFPHYECPLYRTPERRGVLATTGHSTNFVMDLMIPSDKPAAHWIRRGVAFLLSLAD